MANGHKQAGVWHCSLSLRAEEGALTDQQWGDIANDFVDAMGFTEASGRAQCRWVAINHGTSQNGNHHIHIAVSLVREDGTKAFTHGDYKRAQKTCRELETKYGLEELSSVHATRGYDRAEKATAVRDEREMHRASLAPKVRASAGASGSEAEFVRRARDTGLLVRPRYAKNTTDVIVGYSVAERPPRGERPIWFGGGTLATDLRLGQLRQEGRTHPRRPSRLQRSGMPQRGTGARSSLTLRRTPLPVRRSGLSTPVTPPNEFLGLSGEVAERDLESALTSRITETLRELGQGFSFVGRQVHFDVDGDDFYVDMLFFNIEQSRYVVVELKTGKFQPDYAGYAQWDVMQRSSLALAC